MSRFVIRFDDVCPGMAWARFQPFLDFFDRHPGVKPLLGVVPDNRDAKLDVAPPRTDFWDLARQWHARGWTLAQHGTTHEYSQPGGGLLGVGTKSEFTGLPLQAQKERLARGKAILEREGVWQPCFMAPSHSFDDNTLRALRELGFEAVTDGYGMYPYDIEGITLVPQLFSTPMHLGFGVYTLCLHVNSMSDDRIAKTLSFMTQHTDRLIGFNEARRARAPRLLSSAARAVSSSALRALRNARRGS
ncbi:DUF2334 domain-containing protein [Roseateles sp. NT4]|uniref:DUF2334 domain-containing protein n=1 Tax=Roseateles sp. NT4 TaxID=3453715 RepID=UPI003EEE975F